MRLKPKDVEDAVGGDALVASMVKDTGLVPIAPPVWRSFNGFPARASSA